MSNTNCKSIENSNSCNYCNSCYSCDYCNYCNSCYSCDYCNYCYYCNSCDYCNYCNYCYSCGYCNYCNYCYYCGYCNYCYYCYYCYGLQMSEKMIFCLGEGRNVSSGAGYQKNLQIFNKPVTEEVYRSTKSALNVKSFKLPIAKWIEEKDMTEEEKSAWSSYKQTGGYLKTLSYTNAWKEMWAGMSTEDKKFFSTLPNFDAEIFGKITGIKYEVTPNLSGKEVEVKLDGVTYKAIIK